MATLQAEQSPATLESTAGQSRSYMALSLRRLARKKLAMFFLGIILVMYGSGILAHWITPYGYNDQDLSLAKQGPTWGHPFGTDRLGRDQLTRVIFGLRTTVIITLTSLIGGSLLLGIILGLISGYMGRLADGIIMRTGEVTSAFPEIFLLLILLATVRPRVVTWVQNFEDATGIDWIIRLGFVDFALISFALSIFSWFGMARLVRGQVLQVRGKPILRSGPGSGGLDLPHFAGARLSQRGQPGNRFGFGGSGGICRSGAGPELYWGGHPAPDTQLGADDL